MLKKLFYFFLVTTLLMFALSIPCAPVFAMSTYDVIYEGIDVSHWQEYIEYDQVKASGIEIVYIKSSEGRTHKDAYFEKNYENAKKNKI